MPFLVTFVVLFATTGIGNGSTFRMIPIIFSKEQAGPVLGWTSAIAAYGAYLIPKIFATQIEAGTPEYALYGFAVYYASCLVRELVVLRHERTQKLNAEPDGRQQGATRPAMQRMIVNVILLIGLFFGLMVLGSGMT